MIESIAAFSMRGVGAMTDGDQQSGSVAWWSVFRSTPTPTVEPMTAGTQPMLPRAGFDRDLLGTETRHDSSFIEFESHIGRALPRAPKSITMPKMDIRPTANALSEAERIARARDSQKLDHCLGDLFLCRRQGFSRGSNKPDRNDHEKFSHFVCRCFPLVASSCIQLQVSTYSVITKANKHQSNATCN